MNDLPGSAGPDDERMRRLLNEAVSDVEPRPSLEVIRSRTTSSAGRRPWIWGVGAAVVATAATITAVTVISGTTGTTGAPAPGFADESSTAVLGAELPVYYVGDTGRGPRLFREFHPVEFQQGASEAGLAAREAGLAAERAVNTADPDPSGGTIPGPLDPDYRTDWPAGTHATVSSSAGVITVDLTGATGLQDRPLAMTAAEAELAIEQVIYSVQATLQTRDPVIFQHEGKPTDTVLGVPTSEPLSEGDPSEVLAQVWIIEPAEGAQLLSGFEVTGLANAFEANVQWELMRGDRVVKEGFTTAEECCTMSPYSFKVTAPPGDYTLVVHDSDPSGGEGFPPWQDTKNITILN